MSEEMAEVWLVTDADDFRAMHEMIALHAGGETTIFEPHGGAPERPVERVLAVAGFVPGSAASPVKVRCVACDAPVTYLRGFAFPASKRVDVEMTLRAALAGNLGGFLPVAAGQTGFHRATMAFEHAWSAAGGPPVRVRHPERVPGIPASADRPSPLHASATRNSRMSAILRLRGETGEHDGEGLAVPEETT